MKITMDLREVKQLERNIQRLGKLPQKCVTSAAGKGATIVKRGIRNEVPVDTGTMKSAIIRKGEKSRVKGKKVYETTFDPGFNDALQKPIKQPGIFGGGYPKAYYPSSMEYGFLTRSKGGGISYFPGYHFMKEGAEKAESAQQAVTISTLNKNLEKEWLKK